MLVAAQNLNRYIENSRKWSEKDKPEIDMLKGRVTTRTCEFKIGKLGVIFTAKNLEFEPVEAEKAFQSFCSKSYPRTQREEREVRSAFRQLSQAQNTFLEGSIPLSCRMKYAIDAYSRQSGSFNHIHPGRALGKV